jgi:hypothetical protein
MNRQSGLLCLENENGFRFVSSEVDNFELRFVFESALDLHS